MKRLLAAFGVAFGVFALAPPATAAPGPSDAPEYWFDRWDVPGLWASGVRGQGVTIAEIDTGVNAGLPQLYGRVLSGTDLGAGGNGHVDRDVDTFGHGTAMASIMVARPGPFDIQGLAPGAKILPIAVPLAGTTDANRPGSLAQAIVYAADHHAQIISMSLGGKRTASADDDEPCPDDEQAAIYHALRKDVLVIAAVGNTGPTANTVEAPGSCLGVLTVGAVDESGTVAGFSGRQHYLTLVAPGVDVPSLGRLAGQAFSGEGTSQATALTSAAAALVWSKYPHSTAREISTRLLATLDDRRTQPSTSYGYGQLDAGQAVTANVDADGPNPVYDAVGPFLRRDTAFLRSPTRPPHPAATRGSTGAYAVRGHPRFAAPRVVTGLALAAGGLLLVVAALATLYLRRRRRPHVIVGTGDGWPG